MNDMTTIDDQNGRNVNVKYYETNDKTLRYRYSILDSR